MKGIEIKLDITTPPKNAVFKDWQLKVLECIEYSQQIPIGSKAVWECVNHFEKISRASVIMFLQALHEIDLIDGVNASGKGGFRLEYRFIYDRDHFFEMLATLIMGQFIEAFPNQDLKKVLDIVTTGAALD